MAQTYVNILVTCMVNLGDVVLASSCAQLLKEYCPQAKITYMVKKNVAPVLANHPYIDALIVPDYQAKKKSIRQMCSLVADIRQRRFDLCVSLDRKSRPALLALLAGIPTRVIGDRLFDVKSSFVTKLYTQVIKTPEDFRNTHQAAIFQSVINGFFGQQHNLIHPVLGTFSEAESTFAERILATAVGNPKKLALCIRGTFFLKNWPTPFFAEVINALSRRHNASFFLVGMKEDFAAGEELRSLLEQPETVHNLCGQTTLRELMALLAKTDGMLTVDTGAMHIAAAANVPVAGIFRCISAQRWRPLCTDCEVLTLHLPDCPQSGPPEVCPEKPCLDELLPATVLQAAERLFWNE